MGGPPEPAKSKKGLIMAAGFGGVSLIVLITVIVMVSGTSATDEQDSYIAGYRVAMENRLHASFGLQGKKNEDGFQEFKKDYSGKPVMKSFLSGLKDGKRNLDPKHGEASLKAVAYDVSMTSEVLENIQKVRCIDAKTTWAHAQSLQVVIDRWKSEEAPTPAVDAILRHKKSIEDRILIDEPDFAPAREAKGEFKYENDLAEYIDAGYLLDGERTKAKKLHESLVKAAGRSGGWLPARRKTQVEDMKSRYAKKENAYKKMTGSPFYAKAQKIKEEVAKDLKESIEKAKSRVDDLRKSLEKQGMPQQAIDQFVKRFDRVTGEREFLAVIRAPYVVFVEKNEQWDETHMAETQVLQPLGSLNRIFLEKYGKKFGLEDPTEPIPVVFLRDQAAYQQYTFGKLGMMNPSMLAHFEHDKGRLVVYSETDPGTLLHEGTHQLFWFHARVKSDFNEQSYWFQEGVAEWFGGARRTVNKETREWDYEVGLLQEKRIGRKSTYKQFFARRYKLEELIELTYADRGKMAGVQTGMNYAQGWMLIYFLNYFDMDDATRTVKVDTPDRPVRGRYADVWEKMLGYVLTGKEGKPHTGKEAFLDAAGVSSVDELKEMSNLFDSFQRWVLEKLELRQSKDKRLVPWDKAYNKRGEKMGNAEDDTLPPDPDWTEHDKRKKEREEKEREREKEREKRKKEKEKEKEKEKNGQ